MAEFAYNNSTTTANIMTPFYANYDFHPVAMGLALTELLNSASTVFAHWMHVVQDESRKGLEEARQ